VAKAKIVVHPKHPERICWGCDKYCSADDLRCGNGTIRTQHPVELFGTDWMEWELAEFAADIRIVTVEELVSGTTTSES
jgi:hypothetical protein